METFRLISMTDFVIRKYKDELVHSGENWRDFLEKYARITKSYADFLKQPLKLEMFVPCDDEGNVLDPSDAFKSCEKGFLYGKAKKNVLFKGFEIEDIGLGLFAIRKNGWILMRCSKSIDAKWENRDAYLNIESLTHFKLELTDSAIKQIVL